MKLIFWLFIFGIIYLLIRSYWGYLISPVDSNSTKKESFLISKDESTTQIAESLSDKGFIRSTTAFTWLLKQSGRSNEIQAGDYVFSKSMSTQEVVSQLTNGANDKWVTLIEGWRNEEIADRLNKDLDINQSDFLDQAKEGYMFPDTYLFNSQAKVSDIIGTLENNFDSKFDSSLQQKVSVLGLTRNQAVILASIVEREARSDGVRQKVASILLKRLNVGMALDADSTVQFARDSEEFEHNNKMTDFWKPITQADYENIKSSYNTYLNPGLPPGPICNPSLSSLKAVANADPSTPYLYYYHDAEGNSYYEKTLDEHNQDVANHP